MTTREAKPSTTRAAIYARISKDDGTALGVARQIKDCKALATTKGWTVDPGAVFTDNDVSASTGKRRPQYEAALAYLRDGRASALVVWDMDRLTRRPIELERFMEDAEHHGWELASVGGLADLATASGRMSVRFVGAVARAEVERSSRRLKAKSEELALAGKRGGRVPYGWQAGAGDGRDVLHPDEAPVVREIVARVIAGDSLRSIALDFDARGIPTSRGARRWDGSGAVRALALRPSNAGLRVHQGRVLDGIEGQWEPIVSRADWEKVQAVITDRARRSLNGRNGSNAPRWLLSGLAVCGREGCRCEGAPLWAHLNKRGKNPEPRYVCKKSGVTAKVGALDAFVTDAVLERLSRPDARFLLAAADRHGETARAAGEAATELARVKEAYAAGLIDLDLVIDATARLRPVIDAAEVRLSDDVRALVEAGDREAVEARWDGLGLAQRRVVIAETVRVTVLYRGRGTPTKNVPVSEWVAIDWVA